MEKLEPLQWADPKGLAPRELTPIATEGDDSVKATLALQVTQHRDQEH